jgi:hypothetical protein
VRSLSAQPGLSAGITKEHNWLVGGGGLLPTATDQELRREYALPSPIPGRAPPLPPCLRTLVHLGRLQA